MTLSAGISQAVLLAAALETYASGSPVRSWVMVILAGYSLAGSIAWRLRGWHPNAGAAVTALFTMAAITAWLPGGLSTGLRLATMTTSTLLCLMAAAAALIAAAVVWQARRWPLAARGAAVFAALYSATAFLVAIARGETFAALFTTGSFWQALPYALQGATIGGFVLLPLGLVVSAVRAGARLPGADSPRRSLYQAAALAAAVAIIAATLPLRSPDTVAASTAGGATPTPSSATTPMEPIDPVALLNTVDRVASRIGRSDWDVESRADTLPEGVEAAFALVRDEVAYEPYAGALRGAWGAYSSRAGNAVDRALLLAHLLNRKGIKTRFAFGRLQQQDRERLLLRAFERPRQIPTLPSGSAGFQQRLFDRAARDYERVRATLGDRLPPVTEPTRETLLAEMDPHVWVQAEAGEKWIDLDPSFSDSQIGVPLAGADSTADALPPELYQRVSVRVIAEHLSDGVLVPTTLLSIDRNAVDLCQTQIALVHQPTLTGVKGLGGAISNALGRRTDNWTPVLWIAGELTYGTNLDVARSSFVSESLEFELQWPGGRREVTRRPLASRGDAAWRERAPLDAGALTPLVTDDQGPIDMQAVHNVWLSASLHNLADYMEGLQELLLDGLVRATTAESQSAGESDDFGRQLWPFALHNLTAVMFTDHVTIPMLNDTPGVRLYADGPRISIFTTGPSSDDRVRAMTDLRRDHLRGLAQPGVERTVAEKKLQFGLLQGALEHEFIVDFAVAHGDNDIRLTSTSSQLANSDLAVLMPGVTSADATGAGSASALVRRARAAESIVVAPSARLDERDAWWEIDARTGDAHAVGGPGLHNGILDLRGKGGKQMNPSGGPKISDGRSRAQKVIDRNEAFREMKAKEWEAKQLRGEPPGRTNPARAQGGQRGGGMEYAILVAAVHLAAAYAIWRLSIWMEAKLIEELLKTIEWIGNGGFRRAITSGIERARR